MHFAPNGRSLDDLQVRIAHSLGVAYSHEWACALAEPVATALWRLGGAEEIARVVAKVRDVVGRSFPGIEAPTVREDGAIVHTTGSGRLRWEVYEDGYTRITVSRPSGDVLCASVGADGEVVVSDLGEPFAERHVSALHDAVGKAAEIGQAWMTAHAAVDKAFAPLRQRALPDEELCAPPAPPGCVYTDRAEA